MYIAKNRIGLSTTKSKFNHKYSGSPTENVMPNNCSQSNNR